MTVTDPIVIFAAENAARIKHLTDKLIYDLKIFGKIDLKTSPEINSVFKFCEFPGNLEGFRKYIFDVLCTRMNDEKDYFTHSYRTSLTMHTEKKINAPEKTKRIWKCSRCKTVKDITEFNVSKKTGRIQPYCKTCKSEYAAEQYKKSRKIIGEKAAKPGALPSGKVYDEHFKPNFVKSPGVIYKILKFLKLLK